MFFTKSSYDERSPGAGHREEIFFGAVTGPESLKDVPISRKVTGSRSPGAGHREQVTGSRSPGGDFFRAESLKDIPIGWKSHREIFLSYHLFIF